MFPNDSLKTHRHTHSHTHTLSSNEIAAFQFSNWLCSKVHNACWELGRPNRWVGWQPVAMSSFLDSQKRGEGFLIPTTICKLPKDPYIGAAEQLGGISSRLVQDFCFPAFILG